MLAQVGRLDPQQILCDVVIMAVAQGFTTGYPSCQQPTKW